MARQKSRSKSVTIKERPSRSRSRSQSRGRSKTRSSSRTRVTKTVVEKRGRSGSRGRSRSRSATPAPILRKTTTTTTGMVARKFNRSKGRRTTQEVRRRSPSTSNKYLALLMDPFTKSGAKVPDLVSYPSTTFRIQQDITLTSSAFGTIGFVMYPRPTNFYAIASQITSGSTTFSWTTSNAIAISSISQNYALIRPVAMGVQFEFIGATQNDGGVCGMTTYTRGDGSSGVQTPSGLDWGTAGGTGTCTIGPLENSPYSTEGRAKTGGYMLWRPMDNDDLVYFPPGNTQALPSLAAIWAGLSPNTACIKARLFLHMEALPNNDAFSQVTNVGPSPISMTQLSEGLNVMASVLSYGELQDYIPNMGQALQILKNPLVQSFATAVVRKGARLAGLPINV